MLEPEALGRVWVLGLLDQGRLIAVALIDPVARLLLDPLPRLLRELALELLLLLTLAQLRAQPVLLELALVLVLLVLRGRRLQERAEIVVLGDVAVLLGALRLGLILVVRLQDPVLVARTRRGVRDRQRATAVAIVGPEDVRRGQQLRRGRRGGASVAVGRGALCGREQRRQGAGEGVDLVRREHRAVRQLRLVLGEQPLQPQQQRELAPPAGCPTTNRL